MSVYIKNMEMPKCCAECVALHDDGNSLTCLITHEPRGYIFPDTEERMSNCPLVPVPEHGRLIDADALEKEAQKRMLICGKNNNHFQKPYEVMRAIALAPTIIPAEEETE